MEGNQIKSKENEGNQRNSKEVLTPKNSEKGSLAAQASLGPSWLCAGLCADCLAEAVQNGFLLNSADLAKDR
jgi:hypothetical protein